MQWLNYHHLYYFRVIAKEGGIASAAKKLRLGQPTLSTQLKQLESSLGHALFERKNRRLNLTEAGQIALEYADSIFSMGNEMLQVLGDASYAGRSHVRVGAFDSIPKHVILKLTQNALKFGHCAVTILEGKGDDLARELFAHQIDLMLSDYPPISSERGRTFSKSVAEIPVAVFGAHKFLPLRKGFPQSLAGNPFVMPTVHTKLRHDLDHFFSAHKIRILTLVETQDTSVQKLMGIEGLGLVALPEIAAKDLMADKKLFKIGVLPEVKQQFWLVSAARRIENPIAARLMRDFRLS